MHRLTLGPAILLGIAGCAIAAEQNYSCEFEMTDVKTAAFKQWFKEGASDQMTSHVKGSLSVAGEKSLLQTSDDIGNRSEVLENSPGHFDIQECTRQNDGSYRVQGSKDLIVGGDGQPKLVVNRYLESKEAAWQEPHGAAHLEVSFRGPTDAPTDAEVRLVDDDRYGLISTRSYHFSNWSFGVVNPATLKLNQPKGSIVNEQGRIMRVLAGGATETLGRSGGSPDLVRWAGVAGGSIALASAGLFFFRRRPAATFGSTGRVR